MKRSTDKRTEKVYCEKCTRGKLQIPDDLSEITKQISESLERSEQIVQELKK